MILTLLATLALTVAAARYRHGLVPFVLPVAGLAVALTFSRIERDALGTKSTRRALVGGLAMGFALLLTLFLLPAP